MFTGRYAGGCLSAAVLVCITATTAGAWKNPLESRYTTAPLDVCDQGAFFVGGVPKVSNYVTSAVAAGQPQQIIIGSMYVNFQIPKKRRQWPIIMVHGGGYTGSAAQSTPHGTEGWDTYAVRNNLATFVVDQAGRGRSGFDNTPIHEARAENNVSLIPNTIRATSSNGIFTGWFGHLINGSNILTGTLIQHGDPGDPQCASNPNHCTYHPQYALDQIDPNIEDRIGALGPAPNPANNTYLALETYKWGVPNTEHTLPTSTCQTCVPMTVNAPDTWSPRGLAELVAGLGGAIVMTHSQSGSIGHHMVRVLKENGHLDKLKGLITHEGVCSFANSGTTAADYVNIPYLGIKGDYTNLGQAQCTATAAAIEAAGGTAEYIDLADPVFEGRFNGTTHMAMLGTNNLDFLDVVFDWVDANIPNPIVQPASCPNGPPPGKGPQG